MTAARPEFRLAVLANAPSPYHGYFLRRLASELDRVEVHALFTHATKAQPWTVDAGSAVSERTFADGDETIDDPVPGRFIADWRKGGRILEYLSRNRIDALICQGYSRPDMLRVLLGARRRGIRAFLRGDSNSRDEVGLVWRKRVVKKLVLPRLFRRLAGVMAVGSLGVEYYRTYGVPPARLHIVPLEPDYEAIRCTSAVAVSAFQRRMGLNDGRRRFLYCGRLAHEKRVDLLLKAFADVAAERADWDLVVLGKGPLRASLEASVPSALAGRTHWLGFLDVDDVRTAYHACDVLVLPSDHEPWALVVNEAMAAGLVPVVSDVVGAGADLVCAGSNGAVFERGNAPDLARALLEVTDAARLPAMRDAVAERLRTWRRSQDPIDGVRAALGIERAVAGP